MKLIVPFVAALALAHDHHEHKKRDVVTVVVTQVITAGAEDAQAVSSVELSSESTRSTTTLSSASSYESSASSYGSSASSYESSYESSTESASQSYSSSTASASSASASSSSSSSAQAKGISYSPYTDSGSCKDASTVASDIAILSEFDIIRLYDTDCDAITNVLAAKTSSQKLFIGIYYLAKISESVSIIASAVSDWSDVYTVSVGNELVNDGEATTAEIQSAVESTRSALTAVGYTGPVVSVDTLVAVQNNPALCDYSDYIAVNSHPFWDGNVSPEDSASFLETGIANIKSLCGKDVLITETGWPTQGSDYINCVPSKANQKLALDSIASSSIKDSILLFTTYNDPWKAAGSYGVEQFWGIFTS